MQVSAPLTALAPFVLGLAAALSGCRATPQEVDTLKSVDDLLGKVERMCSEIELAKERAGGALHELESLADGAFAGDPVKAFERFVRAVELSEVQAKSLQNALVPMHAAAERVFARWEADANELHIDSLRERSLQRREETRTRYLAIVSSAEKVQKAYDAYNVGLRDHAKYLGNDFNAASLTAIGSEIKTLSGWSRELDRRFDECRQAAERYVSAAALPQAVEVAAAPKG